MNSFRSFVRGPDSSQPRATKRRLLSLLLTVACCITMLVSPRSQGNEGESITKGLKIAESKKIAESIVNRIVKGEVPLAGPYGANARVMSVPSYEALGGVGFGLASTVFVAFDQSGVPCLNLFGSVGCGLIGSGDAIAIPFPRSDVPIGASTEWTVLIESNSYSGPVIVVVLTIQNGTLTDSDFFNGTVLPDQVSFVSFPQKSVFAPPGKAFIFSLVADPAGNTLSTAVGRYEVH